jgi:hypothetical protein
MRRSPSSTATWMPPLLCLSMMLWPSSSNAQERVSVDVAVVRQCHQDAIKADQYDDLREACERLREEIWGLRKMHEAAIAERDALRLRIAELEGRWSWSTWFALGAVSATAVLLGAVVAL